MTHPHEKDPGLSPRATRHATQEEVKTTLRQSDGICEWRSLGHTFISHSKLCTIVRLDGIMGGDVFPEVIFGWKYDNVFSWQIDWNEITYVAQAVLHERPSN